MELQASSGGCPEDLRQALSHLGNHALARYPLLHNLCRRASRMHEAGWVGGWVVCAWWSGRERWPFRVMQCMCQGSAGHMASLFLACLSPPPPPPSPCWPPPPLPQQPSPAAAPTRARQSRRCPSMAYRPSICVLQGASAPPIPPPSTHATCTNANTGRLTLFGSTCPPPARQHPRHRAVPAA